MRVGSLFFIIAISLGLGFIVETQAATPTLVLLPNDASSPCLDGTPGGYYWQAALTSADSQKWIIFFEGGGWCYTPEECVQRAGTSLGSSLYWPPTATFQGVMSDNPQANPDFYSWNKAYFKYCDGASFSGNSKAVIGNTTLYYQGHAILHGLMNALFDRGLKSATDVLVSGCSAGGLSTYLHIDEIHSMLPKSTVVKAFPGSGFFMDIPNMDDVPVYPMQMENVFYFQNCRQGVNQDCIKANADAPHRCIFAPHTYPHIQTPLFIVNSFVDSWQMGNVYGVDVPSFANCQYAGPNNCSQHQINQVYPFSRDMVISITSAPTFSKAGNGVFLTSCWGHCAETGNQAWDGEVVSGVVMRTAIANWYFNRPNTNNLNIDCYLTSNQNCNPTC